MVCVISDVERYVWDGQECQECDGSSEAMMYGCLVALILFGIAVVFFMARSRRSTEFFDRVQTKHLEEFFDRVQTKYKIIVTFTQIISKVSTLYPITLPTLFANFWGNFRFLSFDLSILPLNCFIDSNFHGRLVATTIVPGAFICVVAIVWIVLRQRLVLKGGKNLRVLLAALDAKSVSVVIIFLFTVFPMVSTTIFQVCHRIANDFVKSGYSEECLFVTFLSLPLPSLPTQDIPIRHTA